MSLDLGRAGSRIQTADLLTELMLYIREHGSVDRPERNGSTAMVVLQSATVLPTRTDTNLLRDASSQGGAQEGHSRWEIPKRINYKRYGVKHFHNYYLVRTLRNTPARFFAN